MSFCNFNTAVWNCRSGCEPIFFSLLLILESIQISSVIVGCRSRLHGPCHGRICALGLKIYGKEKGESGEGGREMPRVGPLARLGVIGGGRPGLGRGGSHCRPLRASAGQPAGRGLCSPASFLGSCSFALPVQTCVVSSSFPSLLCLNLQMWWEYLGTELKAPQKVNCREEEKESQLCRS